MKYELQGIFLKPQPEAANRHPPVRWRAWWQGSLYANPLKDILRHVESRLRHTIDPKEEWVAGEMGSIFFTGGKLCVRDPFRHKQVYEFYSRLRLEIYYTTPDKARADRPYHSWISFPDYHGGKKVPFVFREEEIRRLTSFLLQRKINFKEYMNGKRAFRCRYLDAEQIDHVIEKYGIEW
jgi:hypothetical protein